MLRLSILSSSRKLLTAAIRLLKSRVVSDGGDVESAGCANAAVKELIRLERVALILGALDGDAIIDNLSCLETDLENLIITDI